MRTNIHGGVEKEFAAVNSDSAGLPDDVGTDENDTVERGQPISPARWGRTGEETPGGLAILEDGSINTSRFSEGPNTELEVTWWNKRMVWKVRREATGHRVVVARVLENIWRIHIMVGAAIIVVAVAGMVLFGGLPVLYGGILGLVLALVGYGALAWEQRAGDERAGIEEIMEMDSVMWSGVRNKARAEYLSYTKEGQKRRYDEAVAHYRTLYDRKYGAEGTGVVGKTYASGGKVLPVPKFKVPQKITDEFLDESSRLGPDAVVEKITALLLPARQDGYRKTLLATYRKEPARVQAVGRGVRFCECAACQVQAELGVVVELSGAEAARRRAEAARKQTQSGAADPITRLEQLRKAANWRRDDQEGTDGGVSKESRKAREALAKADASARERSLAQADEDEKQAHRELREASRARIANGEGGKALSAQDDPERTSTTPVKKTKKGQSAIIGVAAVVALMIVVLVAVIVKTAPSQETEVPEITLSESTASTTSTAVTSAPQRPTNGEVVGVPIAFGPEDPGSQQGGAAVIAAYDHAYYVTRSSAEASALYAPGVQPPVDETQNAIDAQPIGTRHSLVITPVVIGSEYDVLLKVTWPGTPEQEFPQKIFTTYSNGKYFVLRMA